MRRVDGFAHVLGLDNALTRRIPEAVIADMLTRPDEKRVVEARMRMISAAESLMQDAAEDNSETWRIGYCVLTDDELIGLAARRGIRSAAETGQ